MDLVADYGSDSDSGSNSSKSGEDKQFVTVTAPCSAAEPTRSFLECSDDEDDDDGDSPSCKSSASGRESVGTTNDDVSKTNAGSKALTVALPLPDLGTFVPSGESAIFKSTKGLYDSDRLPGVKRRSSEALASGYQSGAPVGHGYNSHADTGIEDHPEDRDGPGSKRRKRHGVTNTLLPPKRATPQLRTQIHKDQPWMQRKG